MVTLKWKDRGKEFQIIGEVDELIDFLNKYPWESTATPTQATQISPTVSNKVTPTIQTSEEEELIDIPTPPDKDVVDYITSKPDFSHNVFEAQKHFFGRTFKSRGKTQRMYHRTARQLRLIREKLEKQYRGKFVEKKSKEGTKQFVFQEQPSQAKIVG